MGLDRLSLVTGNNCDGEVHLLVGSGGTASCSLTVGRVRRLLAHGAVPVLVGVSSAAHGAAIAKELQGQSSVRVLQRDFMLSDLTTLGRALTGGVVDRVFVNLAVDKINEVEAIFAQCRKLRIPINTYQQPEFSTFSLTPTYTDPQGSGLQISVSTNGRGYLLAERVKREIVAGLPANISQVVSNMGLVRDQLIAQDNNRLLAEKYWDTGLAVPGLGYGLNEDNWESHKFNRLIHEFDQTAKDQQQRRTRWLSQIMAYYPLAKLATVTLQDLENGAQQPDTIAETSHPEHHETQLQNQTGPKTLTRGTASADSAAAHGQISLVGSGPGSVSMLTLGALNEIKTADIILADKLVPQTVLNLIPPTTECFIAKKFPGNAENAQQELLARGLSALQEGKKVVRLKQGDPYIFGRGGEEYSFFAANGYEALVLPGISSSLASTVVAKIPATQRGIADQVLVCTGTGRKGALPEVPDYVASRTTVFLMALHRADLLTEVLLQKGWDADVPLAIIERASCPDQRVTRTLLKYLPQVVQEIGSRPPGLLVVGHAVNHLIPQELVQFAGDHKYHIEEGFQDIDIQPQFL
ncbi:uroporphyrinogen-III C-methyltransferase KNAG_0C06340 [Huiozyma naganishii CBS 8797]|uniref:uroporphyrinogen-III C-methyltransferase n=1 Tax=Huiozyma naganishii (strain ATCC MYA-139 / BCRC 22969 / CBS 8797 / KCTC 17520 / NBRC 10181 / NCYC 3082 / Yp74L-3) TaxID=1071383 RepID=J7RXC4_HUIN7|nr:hypothetical protein KNAG_0C06340 [Kazachstania naganishii CBS 8797]CCK69727.1 hypothetical protein KNAG_0C06340 [Kazachstania naganishii CBS 8797]